MSPFDLVLPPRGVEHGVYEQGHQWRRVEYGNGCAARVDGELGRLGIERPFLLSTPSVVRSGLFDRVRAAVRKPAGEFGECRAHVPEDVVALAAAQMEAAGADGVVAIGGSSVIDTAKATALLLGHEAGTMSMSEIRTAGVDRNAAPLPTVALSTTLSGGEFTGTVATTDQAGVKHLMVEPRLAPRSVMLDPQLTLSTPARLWRSTGIKTLSDAIEQIFYGATPVTDTLCARAIEFFRGGLPADLQDLQARLRCQQAAWMSLFGLHDAQGAVGIGAALRHQVAVTFGVPHGEVTCVFLPHVVRFNAPVLDGRSETVATALGLDPGGDGIETWELIAENLRSLVAALDLPGRLSEIVDREVDLDALAGRVLAEKAAIANPRPVESRAQIVALLERAW